MMVHAAEGTLQAYLDGEIDSAAERALRDHVAACAVCAAELELLEHASGVIRESLAQIDVPAPVLRARAAVARGRTGGGRRVARIGAWGLAKAAMLTLLLAGVAAAAIPDVRRALETTFSRVVAMFSGAQDRTADVPVQLDDANTEAVAGVVRGESFVAPAEGRVVIALHAPAEGDLEVTVRLIDGGQAHVETATSATAARRVGPGRLELTDLGAGSVTIGLPRDVREAAIEVDGVVRVYKQGGSLRGPDGATRGSEVRFMTGS
jgi:hypothetical protein